MCFTALETVGVDQGLRDVEDTNVQCNQVGDVPLISPAAVPVFTLLFEPIKALYWGAIYPPYSQLQCQVLTFS